MSSSTYTALQAEKIWIYLTRVICGLILVLVQNSDNFGQLKGFLLSTFWEWHIGLDTLKLVTKEVEIWFLRLRRLQCQQMCHQLSCLAILLWFRAVRRIAWSSRLYYCSANIHFPLYLPPTHGKSVLPCPCWVWPRHLLWPAKYWQIQCEQRF